MDAGHVWYVVWAVLWALDQRPCQGDQTRNVVCKFQGDFCDFRQDHSADFDWTMSAEEASLSPLYEPNEYIRAYRDTTHLRPGSLARLVSPIYEVTTPSLLILQFKHFKTEGDGSRLRISVHSATRAVEDRRDDQPFFRSIKEVKSELPWTLLEGKTGVFAPFQLVIEAEVGYFTESIVAIDDIILTLDAYPAHFPAKANGSALTNSSGNQHGEAGGALTSLSGMTSHGAPGWTNHKEGAQAKESDHEGVSLCFVLALTSSSLLVIVLVIFMLVILSINRKRRRYRRFNFSHDYEEIKNKEAYNKTTSVSAMAIMKERPQPRLVYHNRHTSFSRIQSLSSCLSRLSIRDSSLHSSIYAEITEPDLDMTCDMSDGGIGNCTTLTTTCTGTWDICDSSSSSGSDTTLAGGSYVTGSSINQHYLSLSDEGSISQNDSGWVENIIYERTSDISSLDSTGTPFSIDSTLKGLDSNEKTTGFKPRQRLYTL